MKNNYQAILRFIVAFAILVGGSISAIAQNKWSYQDDGCGATRWHGNPGNAFNLEIKEQTLSTPPKKLSIDTRKNGGVRIRGWERNEIFIRACVQAAGSDTDEARARTAAVRIESVEGVIRAVSPSDADGSYSFGASYDIRVPVNTDLTIKTNNGGINIYGISGSIEFDLNNGGAVFDKIQGGVRGQTINGNLTFNLSGDKWEGGGVDVRTTNGNILISFPENYSARIETGTRRGNFRVNFPIEKTPDNNYALDLNVGAGGAIIKAQTNSGQVSIQRRTTIKEVKE